MKGGGGAGGFWFNRILIFVFVVAAGLMIGLIIKSFIMPSIMVSMVEEFTDVEPLALPAPVLSEAEREAVHIRVDDYFDRVKAGLPQEAETLELDADALNALIQDDLDEDEPWRAFVRIEGDTIRADISYYLDAEVATGALRRLAGRYIRGEAGMTIELSNMRIVARIHSLEVKDNELPRWALERLLGDRAVIDLSEDEDMAAFARNLARIAISDGRVVLISRGTA